MSGAHTGPARILAGAVHPALIATAVEDVPDAGCWDLLAGAHVGRLAVIGADGRPDIFPMDYLVSDRHLFLRTAPGLKLRHLARNPFVAFEAEGDADGFRWSVVVRGAARRLDRDDEIEASGVLDLRSTSPTGKYDYLEITPDAVTGRRFRPQR
ncbi:pyridoxamine 5'-phosphate oxidase family protein [Microbacterium atlanticum]|uniref:pyridoxamine 5'-phosphate oxidase family protein n=1 Tax=Microbacterium atlanticum TaxID=2782168 RepID=UPI0018896029|nr:pyridoxamine 5'-phosphate oxidase family protein [Microbacterium atlanticum]